MKNKITIQELLHQLEVKNLSPEQVANILKFADYSSAYCSLTSSLKMFLRTEFKEQFPHPADINCSILELENQTIATLDTISGITNDYIITQCLFSDHDSAN